jgi:hypothetical protein
LEFFSLKDISSLPTLEDVGELAEHTIIAEGTEEGE